MTCVEVSYDYGMAPDDAVLRGMESIREVYGIRRLRVDDAAHRLTVEYDATRLNEATVANLLRRTGLDLKQ
jgi:hypothetical protein